MTATDELLANNEAYARPFDKGDLSLLASDLTPTLESPREAGPWNADKPCRGARKCNRIGKRRQTN